MLTTATCRFCGKSADSEYDCHSDCADSAYQEHLAQLGSQGCEDADDLEVLS